MTQSHLLPYFRFSQRALQPVVSGLYVDARYYSCSQLFVRISFTARLHGWSRDVDICVFDTEEIMNKMRQFSRKDVINTKFAQRAAMLVSNTIA
eukprot:4156104-Amphidinium_carterae.1